MQKEYDVFISYSRKDYIDNSKNIIQNNVISKIIDAFDSNGISYWIDKKGVYSGDAFARVIARNIRASKLFVFVSSDNSNKSEWTSSEIAVANQYKKKIIPFRVDDSTYNDDVILYVARLDHIDFFEDPENALNNLVVSIKKYIQDIEEKEMEELAAIEESKRKAAEEMEKRQKQIEEEQRKKEIEHRAEIERKRKQAEEEIDKLNVELEKIEQEQSEWENKKNVIVAELKEASRQISLLRNKHTELQSKRTVLENQMANDSFDDTKDNADVTVEDSKCGIADEGAGSGNKTEDGLEPDAEFAEDAKPDSGKSFGRWLNKRNICILALSVLAILIVFCIFRCNGSGGSGSYTGVNSVDSDSIALFNTEDSISLEFVDQNTDAVYGIEVSRAMRWDSLYVNLWSDNKLHRVSFVLIKATGGKNDVIPEYKEFREHATDHGIVVASYHSLNGSPSWVSADGSSQAENYYNYVGSLGEYDLPPVLSAIPNAENFDKNTFITRSRDWVNKVSTHYGIKPIIYTSSSAYRDYFKNSGIDALYWITAQDNDKSEGLFVKYHDMKVFLFNGSKIQDYEPKDGILSVFSGSYSELLSFAKNK